MYISKEAIEKADSFDSEKVKEEVYKVKFDGMMGLHEFDADGVPKAGNFKVQKVINGKLVDQK